MNRGALFGCVGLLAALHAMTAMAQTPVERGRYLVDTIMTCHNCHTPMGPNGPQFDKALSGGLRFDEPPFDVTAPNITPDEKGMPAGLTAANFVESIRTGKVHMMENGKAPDPNDIQKVMPWPEFRNMTDDDLNAVYAYLTAIPHADAANLKCPPPKH